MLPKISGYGLSSESSFSIICPHCKKVNEIKVARFVVTVARSEAFECVACNGKFTVEIVPQPSGNLTTHAADVGNAHGSYYLVEDNDEMYGTGPHRLQRSRRG